LEVNCPSLLAAGLKKMARKILKRLGLGEEGWGGHRGRSSFGSVVSAFHSRNWQEVGDWESNRWGATPGEGGGDQNSTMRVRTIKGRTHEPEDFCTPKTLEGTR